LATPRPREREIGHPRNRPGTVGNVLDRVSDPTVGILRREVVG
jgi:hypothetical protein